MFEPPDLCETPAQEFRLVIAPAPQPARMKGNRNNQIETTQRNGFEEQIGQMPRQKIVFMKLESNQHLFKDSPIVSPGKEG